MIEEILWTRTQSGTSPGAWSRRSTSRSRTSSAPLAGLFTFQSGSPLSFGSRWYLKISSYQVPDIPGCDGHLRRDGRAWKFLEEVWNIRGVRHLPWERQEEQSDWRLLWARGEVHLLAAIQARVPDIMLTKKLRIFHFVQGLWRHHRNSECDLLWRRVSFRAGHCLEEKQPKEQSETILRCHQTRWQSQIFLTSNVVSSLGEQQQLDGHKLRPTRERLWLG